MMRKPAPALGLRHPSTPGYPLGYPRVGPASWLDPLTDASAAGGLRPVVPALLTLSQLKRQLRAEAALAREGAGGGPAADGGG